MGLRAYGNGLKVALVQFMKKLPTGERLALRELNQQRFTVKNFGRPVFFKKGQHTLKDIQEAKKALAAAKSLLHKVDVLILDEINIVLFFKILPLGLVLDFVVKRPASLDLILTGRYAPPTLIALADLVTEMKEIKHPYQKRELAKKGIEY